MPPAHLLFHIQKLAIAIATSNDSDKRLPNASVTVEAALCQIKAIGQRLKA